MKAIIIGATGSTGKNVVNQLIKNELFTEIILFVRRDFSLKHEKIRTHIINFDKPEEWKSLVQGDVLFSCLGTTLKQAGSKENQWKIDYDYQYEFAKTAKENGVKQLILVSSMGANAHSSFFYMKMKGKLEEAVKKLNFDRLVIFRPPALERENSDRMGENIGVKVIKFLNKLGFLKEMKPMTTEYLAEKMVTQSLATEKGIFVLEAGEI